MKPGRKSYERAVKALERARAAYDQKPWDAERRQKLVRALAEMAQAQMNQKEQLALPKQENA